MVVKAKAPKESQESVDARERAEAAAEKRQVGEVRRGVTQETSALLRRFGIKAAMAGSSGANGFAAGGFSGVNNTGGSFDPAAFFGGFDGADFSRGFGNIGSR